MKNALRTRLGVLAASLWIGLGAICFGVGGDDPSRVSILGSVKVDGEPLDRGTIYLLLVSPSTHPASGSAFIHHGHFAINETDSLVPGTYMVKISGLGVEALAVPAGQEAVALSQTEPLPDRYNEKSELEVVIAHGGTRHLAFDLKR